MDSIVLASKSPRRREILNALHIPFIVHSVDVSETVGEAASAANAVIEISGRKADEAGNFFSSGLIVGVDTVVLLGKRILGKPVDAVEAEEFIRKINGGRHCVLSGLTV